MTSLCRRWGPLAVVCAFAACSSACSSTSTPDGGSVDAGCSGCQLTGCAIDGVPYDAGTQNPASVCQVCAPGSSPTGWTNVLDSTACDAGSVCASGQCLPGCFIEGFYAAPGAGNPADSCQLCAPEQSLTGWTNVGADGTPCTGSGGNFCLQGACVSECLIDGGFYSAGTPDPAAGCQSCQPTLVLSAWSPTPDQTSCSEDGGNLCLEGSCVAGCAIQGAVVSPGTPSLANSCFGCQPQQSSLGNTQFPDGTPCGSGGTVCQGGVCIEACAIGGVFYPDGTLDGGNPNVCCNDAVSATSWSPGFGSAGLLATSIEPEALALGDVNGDGISDLVVAHPGLGEIGVLPGLGRAAFGPESLALVGLGPRGVALADLNGDRRTDIAALNGGSATLAVLLQQADGSLQPGPGSPYSTPPGPSNIVAGDVNNDKLDDLVITDNGSGGEVTVWLATVDGGFLPPSSYMVGMQPVALVLADFERDGSLDTATADVGDSTLTILHNNGPGAFAAVSTTLALAAAPSSLVSADFNGDGYPDLAVAGQGSDGGVVAIYLNQGSAPWFVASPDLFAVDGFPSALAAADLNGDGSVDLAVTSQTGGVVDVLLNETAFKATTALFLPPASYAVGEQPTGLAAGSSAAAAPLQGPAPYLVVANVGSDFVSVLSGNCP